MMRHCTPNRRKVLTQMHQRPGGLKQVKCWAEGVQEQTHSRVCTPFVPPPRLPLPTNPPPPLRKHGRGPRSQAKTAVQHPPRA